MSYSTYTDLSEVPGSPTGSFQVGFGLLNPEGIRRSTHFGYKDFHALQGESLVTCNSQAMLSSKGEDFTAVTSDFEQPDQKVKNRLFEKVIPSHAEAPAQLRVTRVAPNSSYQLEVHPSGFRSNRANAAYLEVGSPKALTAAQIAQLRELTWDLKETEKIARSGSTGTIEFTLPMNSNDIVLVKGKRSQGSN